MKSGVVMMSWPFILIGISVLLIFAVIRLMNQHTAEKRLRDSQELVNDAMRIVLPSLTDKLKLSTGSVRSALVADVWGRDILAFEFIIPVQAQQSTEIVYYELSTILKSYALGHDIESVSDKVPALVVSDIWYDTEKYELHVDVAHVFNDATYAYLADLKKVNQHRFDTDQNR